ncbi:MAG: hypothetical protein QGM50_01760 [Anaerolineae bacterium]|nr:hypothetical protein [Anaerolineae bacterium]MDK1080384.1 hypothetical protein [Anaerolineae bacterium]MDK1117495.1 hypothetical protein [Anaerolineae bacterium]
MKALSILLSMVNFMASSLILLSCVSLINLGWGILEHASGRIMTATLVIIIGILTFGDGVQPIRPGFVVNPARSEQKYVGNSPFDHNRGY